MLITITNASGHTDKWFAPETTSIEDIEALKSVLEQAGLEILSIEIEF